MFARVYSLFFFLFIAFPLFAAASVIPQVEVREIDVREPEPQFGSNNNQCNVGSVQCCNSVQRASAANLGSLFGILSGVLGPTTSLVGVTCSPLGSVGGGASCNAQPVCCNNNNFNGIIAIGCSPININLRG